MIDPDRLAQIPLTAAQHTIAQLQAERFSHERMLLLLSEQLLEQATIHAEPRS